MPLDQPGYGDAEYISILNYFILPFIKDWKPNLILVSCGYDAAIGIFFKFNLKHKKIIQR